MVQGTVIDDGQPLAMHNGVISRPNPRWGHGIFYKRVFTLLSDTINTKLEAIGSHSKLHS